MEFKRSIGGIESGLLVISDFNKGSHSNISNIVAGEKSTKSLLTVIIVGNKYLITDNDVN